MAHNYDLEREHRAIRKASILDHYGGSKCGLCPETRIWALHLDHINGNGAEHRLATGDNGMLLYNQLEQAGFPTGFRVLCSNCNWLEYIRSEELDSTSVAIKNRRYKLKLKKQLVTRLGGLCEICQEDRIEVLTIDHFNNNGAAHRAAISSGLSGYPFYRAVLKLADFSGLRCLCFSCNDAQPRKKAKAPEPLSIGGGRRGSGALCQNVNQITMEVANS